MNAVLAGDPDIGNRLPFPLDNMQIFDECKGASLQNITELILDGLVLSKLINDSVPDVYHCLSDITDSRQLMNVS
jgi:plastin-1